MIRVQMKDMESGETKTVYADVALVVTGEGKGDGATCGLASLGEGPQELIAAMGRCVLERISAVAQQVAEEIEPRAPEPAGGAVGEPRVNRVEG